MSPEDRMSVTMGRAHNVCPRSAYLYEKYRRVASSTAPMQRGSVFHEIAARGTLAAIQQDEREVPPELAKAIVDEVLADPAWWVPIEQHDYLREASYRWAAEQALDPAAIVAVETLFVLEVDGMQVRAKIDRATLLEGGAACLVEDYKTSRAMPTYEDIGRKRADGTIAAKDYQLVLYALALAFGVPVRLELCMACKGTGVEALTPGMPRCEGCFGRQWIEIPEPFGVAARAQRFDLEYVFPGMSTQDGLMPRRGVSLTRLELAGYMESLKAQVAQVRHARESGEWPAQYGSHCVECAAPSECPIPVSMRRFAGTVNTREEAVEAATVLAWEKDQHAARRKELIAWVKAQPAGLKALRYGRDQVLEVQYQEASTEIKDKEGMFDALDRAARYGEPFDRADWVTTKSGGPRIKDRRLTEDELDEGVV